MSTGKAAVAAGAKSSQWFANAAKVRSQLASTPILNNVWASRLLFALQTIAVPLAFWFKPLCVCVALFWLVYRASQILYKPLDELSWLLGFDIPSTPSVDLASVKADGAIIHWTLAERPKHKSQLKYELHLNGTVIDNVSIHESAVTITGLQPGAFYVVRVALLHHEFSSRSPAVRFRTKPADSGDFFPSLVDGHETDSDPSHHIVPRVRPYRALRDFTPPSPVTSTPMAREASSGLSTGLSTGKTNSRRPSPGAQAIESFQDSPPNEIEQGDGTETIQQLTEKLDGIRRETEEVERQAKDEDEEELRQKDELTKERDELRSEANEKEKASRNLKREVNTLERQNTAAQNERQKHERLLQQKKQERQKLKDDMVRWERDAERMHADVERIQKDKASYLERAAQEKDTLNTKHAEETSKMRSLDDEVKEKTAEVKKLERSMKDASPNGSEAEPNLVQQLQNDAEEERKWTLLRHNLQQQYQVAYNKVNETKRFHAEQMRYLESLRAERRRQDDQMISQYAAPTLDRVPRRGDSRRSRHSVSDSPRLGAFQVNPQNPFPSSINTGAGAFNSSRFFNFQNGMTLAGPTDEVAMSDEDREKLTGGAAMSPSAGADLIPADLFSGDGDSRTEHVQPLPGLGSLPGLPGLPGPPQSQQEFYAPGPVSPAASSSRSPSVFASPQASQPNLTLGSPEYTIDPDRRSIRSTRSNRAPSGGTGSRFSGMFGIKQRNKNVEEGPPLSKASSMPRQDQGIPGLDSASRKRNSSISGAVFGSVDDGLDGSTESSNAAAAPGRRAFGFFSKEKSGGWPTSFTGFGRRPASPRPGSTHSNELPRPSIESGRWGADAWPSADAAAGARGSPLAFGGWNAPPQQSRIYGSRHPSRRPSVQYGASGPPEDILEDDDSDALDANQTPNLAPIGTKPPPGSKKAALDNAANKLNPNAKDFRSFLGMKFGKTKDSGESSDKQQDGSTPIASTSTTSNLVVGADIEDGSPPNSRKSRDTRSMTTADNSSVAESGRNSPDLVRTPSNSDVAAPSPSLQAKESFMQKITRKSSSSKFSLPTFKREKSRLDASFASNTSTPTQMGVDDEEGMSESIGSLRESKDGGPSSTIKGGGSGRSWSSAFKIGKKKGVESELVSTASGTEDGDDEEEV